MTNTIDTADVIREQRTHPGRANIKDGFLEIVDGRRYDSKTSALIYQHSRGRADDYHYVREHLYRTARGNFLILVEVCTSSAWSYWDGGARFRRHHTCTGPPMA